MEKNNLHAADATAIAEAAQFLLAGRLVAFPTETVYGLGADATNGLAVAAIFAAKDRPRINPLIVHVQNKAEAERHVIFSDIASRLAAAFWPGPLTLVLPRRSGTPLSLLVSAGLETVAVRVPSHPVARALIATAGVPLAAPSANPSGSVSPTTARHVAEGLGSRVAMILDGGATPVGVESTVIGFSPQGTAMMLRPGGVPREAIEAIIGPLIAPDLDGPITAPGQLSSHYAPRARLRLNAETAEPSEVLLGFGPAQNAARNLSAKGDLGEAAANLFAMLRALDAEATAIAVSSIPLHGLGEAINDRLQRAAAPRP
jgi:L-threonylcarbamoyladenylate synthase